MLRGDRDQFRGAYFRVGLTQGDETRRGQLAAPIFGGQNRIGSRGLQTAGIIIQQPGKVRRMLDIRVTQYSLVIKAESLSEAAEFGRQGIGLHRRNPHLFRLGRFLRRHMHLGRDQEAGADRKSGDPQNDKYRQAGHGGGRKPAKPGQICLHEIHYQAAPRIGI